MGIPYDQETRVILWELDETAETRTEKERISGCVKNMGRMNLLSTGKEHTVEHLYGFHSDKVKDGADLLPEISL